MWDKLTDDVKKVGNERVGESRNSIFEDKQT